MTRHHEYIVLRTVSVHEVCGAVYRVQDESGGFVELVAGLVRLFAHEGEGWVLLVEGGGYELFDGLVGFGYEVDGWRGRVSKDGFQVNWKAEWFSRTILLVSDALCRRRRGDDPLSCLAGNFDHEIMDLVEIEVCHVDLVDRGIRGRIMRAMKLD